MATRPRNPQGTTAKWLSAALVAVLVVVVGVLAALAISKSRAGVVEGTPRPVPTFSVDSTQSPTATPAPAPTAGSTTTATFVAPGPAERFLSAGDGVLWRGTAGACGEVEPTLERSTDGGEAWTDVTPRYLGIGQLLAVDAFAGSEAEIVALMGDDCEVQALRTFTQGRFWESYEDVLAASTYVDPDDAATVVTPDGDVAAPCATAWGVRAAGSVTGIICDGTAYALTEGGWQPSATAALGVAVADGELVAATSIADCVGLSITSSTVVCAEDASSSGPVAVAASDDALLIWSADTWSTAER
jgi:hypothetical protein